MIESEFLWFNQKLFIHKDQEFISNGGTLEFSSNIYTTDFQSYSTPLFNISILNNNIRFHVNLKFQDINNILFSIENIFKKYTMDEIYKQEVEIKRIYNKKNFLLKFKTSKNTNRLAIILIIANSEMDFGNIIIPFELLDSIIDLLKGFKNNYYKLSFEYSNRITLNSILNELKEIKEFNKSLPSSIVDLTSNSNERIINGSSDFSDDILDDNYDEQLDFDKYINDNIDNVEIPELNKLDKKINEEYKSILFNDILKNDINNLESLIFSLTTNYNPIEKFKEILSPYINSTLPSIEENILKSACYYSKRYFTFNIQNYIRNKIKIPNIIPIIKYNSTQYSNENINLSYDLLLLSIYIKLSRDKLETRINDASINKSLLYLAFRNYTDIFTFSFIEDNNPTIITNCIINRFNQLSSSDFFKSFEILMEQYNLPKINSNDIKNTTIQILNKVIGNNKTLFIDELHRKDYSENKIDLSLDNNLNYDQILNEFIKLEIELRLKSNDINFDLYSEEVKKLLNINNNENKEINNESMDDNNWVGNL